VPVNNHFIYNGMPGSMWQVPSSFYLLAGGAGWWAFCKVALNGTLLVI